MEDSNFKIPLKVVTFKEFCKKTSSKLKSICKGRVVGYSQSIPESFYLYNEYLRKNNKQTYSAPISVVNESMIGPMFEAKLCNVEVVGGCLNNRGHVLRDPVSGIITFEEINHSNALPINLILNEETLLALRSHDEF